MSLILLTPQAVADKAVVSESIQLNGEVHGDLYFLKASSFNLNNSTDVKGNLFVIGDPIINQNGNVTYAGEERGSGLNNSVYTININDGSSLQKIITGTDPVALPEVLIPTAANGHKWVNLNKGDLVSDWASLRSLNVNSNYGDFVLPVGNYDQVQVLI